MYPSTLESITKCRRNILPSIGVGGIGRQHLKRYCREYVHAYKCNNRVVRMKSTKLLIKGFCFDIIEDSTPTFNRVGDRVQDWTSEDFPTGIDNTYHIARERHADAFLRTIKLAWISLDSGDEIEDVAESRIRHRVLTSMRDIAAYRRTFFSTNGYRTGSLYGCNRRLSVNFIRG